MIQYPQIDPIMLQIGPLAIRWYGMAYVVGILSAFRFLDKDFKALGLTSDHILNVLTALVLGVMLGGRLGYVLFYDFHYFLENPGYIVAFWRGGMSYHGGAIGAVVAMLSMSYVYRVSFLGLLDILGIGSTFGIFFGRIANFINGELYGRVTHVSWGMVFPNAGFLPRHPSQLYEAFFEGLVLFLILWWLKSRWTLRPGQLFSAYLIGYGVFRFCIEFVRQPDAQLGFVFSTLSMGQLLCVVMVVLGVTLYSLMRLGSVQPQ